MTPSALPMIRAMLPPRTQVFLVRSWLTVLNTPTKLASFPLIDNKGPPDAPGMRPQFAVNPFVFTFIFATGMVHAAGLELNLFTPGLR